MITNQFRPFLHASPLLRRVYWSFCDSVAVLDSRYHQRGLLALKRPKNIEMLMKNVSWELDIKISQIQQRRNILQQKKIVIKNSQQYKQLKQKNIHLEEYLRCYSSLSKIIEKCQLNNEWIYKLIGWYNIVKYYKPLVQRLLQSQGRQNQFLIDALSQMKYQWKNSYGFIDQQLRTNRKIQKYYRDLSTQLSIQHLKKLQNILLAPLVITKRNYYEIYAAHHLQDWLKSIKHDDKQSIDNIIWLFQRCIINMMDQEYIISKIEKFLLTTRVALSHENVEKLINLYSLKGRMNKNIYNEYVKPYIVKEKMKGISNIIETIKFIICSQIQDNIILKNLYEMLEVHYQSDKMKLKNSRDKYQLHLYTHYLRVKGYKIKLNQALQNQLNEFCRQKAEGRYTINKIVQQKLKQVKNNKYVSQCLKINNYVLKEFDSTKTSTFQSNFKNKLLQIQLKDMNIYQKPIFCCFQLDFCLHKPGTNQLVDIQIDGMQYVFGSGRLIRSRQIRDEILTFYGIKIHHIDFNSFKNKSKMSEQQLLMSRRVLFKNK